MLKQVADGVFVHESEFLQSNCVVVQGRDGVLLVDPGITRDELADLARDIGDLGQPVVAGFSTHPHWDHVLWHPDFGDVPRYGTARGAASIRELVSTEGWEARVAGVLPPEDADDIPMQLFGLLTGLPDGATRLPWDGLSIRILEHRAHAAGHAALFVEQSGVLVAGDMLSDTLIPFLDFDADDPIGDYLAALSMFEEIADDVKAVVSGHGNAGGADVVRPRIELDRAYVQALREGVECADPRVGPDAPLYWLPDVHRFQVQRLAARKQQ